MAEASESWCVQVGEMLEAAALSAQVSWVSSTDLHIIQAPLGISWNFLNVSTVDLLGLLHSMLREPKVV